VPSGKVVFKVKSMALDNAKPRNPYVLDAPRIYTGQIARAGNGWILNPVSTAPITLLDASSDTAKEVKRLLEQSQKTFKDSVRELAALIETQGLTFKELRHTLEAYRLRCFPILERLKSESQEYREAFAETPATAPSETMTRDDIREVFHDFRYSLKQFALDSGFSHSAVISHFRGKNPSPAIQQAAQKLALQFRHDQLRERRDERKVEVLLDLQCRAEELAGVPPTAAEALPIWEGEPQPVAIATEVVHRFRAVDLDQIRMIDPDGSYGTRWKLHGPIDNLTCAECRELMARAFSSKEIPECPVHPGCRCTILLDISGLEERIGGPE
jgi:hypothetical protein